MENKSIFKSIWRGFMVTLVLTALMALAGFEGFATSPTTQITATTQ